MKTPLVSIVLPTFNRQAVLDRAVRSVIAQTVQDWELILIDDGSTDETPALTNRYAAELGDRFQFIRHPNQGSSNARNRGIEASRGRFVAFLDSDDEFAPTKLERQLALFKKRPELGFVYSDYEIVDLAAIRRESAFRSCFPNALDIRTETAGPGLCVCTDGLFDALLRGYFIATIVGLVRRDVLAGDIRFRPTHAYAEEWYFYLQVTRRAPAGFVDEPLSIHHYSTGSLSRTNPHRNAENLRLLLRDILTDFADLSDRQRKTVRHNLAKVCLQLAYNADRSGNYSRAGAYFWESFRNESRARTAARALAAFVRSAVPNQFRAFGRIPSTASNEPPINHAS